MSRMQSRGGGGGGEKVMENQEIVRGKYFVKPVGTLVLIPNYSSVN